MVKRILKYAGIAIFILSIAFISFLLYETQDSINADPSNIDDKILELYHKDRLGGFAVSVFSKDSIIYMNGFGYADADEEVPYTINTQQYIASIAKTTIGVSLMKAMELGLIDLDAGIEKYLPFQVRNPNFPNHEITIRDLATHTSSLDYNEIVVESLYVEEEDQSQSLRPFIESYFVEKNYGDVTYTNHQPGTNYNYSNIGAGLCAYIIEVASKMTYAEFTKKYIMDQINLENTVWFNASSDTTLHTSYYESGPKGITEVKTSGVSLYPCRDMITDIQDLTNYCQALISQDARLLKSNSFIELFRPQLTSSVSGQSDDNTGLFFQIDRNQNGITYQLTGGTGGDNCINTMMLFDPVTELGYIFMGNTGGSDQNRISHILIYRTLVSLGDRYIRENPDRVGMSKLRFKWHNYYNRVVAFF